MYQRSLHFACSFFLFTVGCSTGIEDLDLSREMDSSVASISLGSPAGGAGGGPAIVIECSVDNAFGTRGTCEPRDVENECQKCVASECCWEQSACNASGPDAACGFGSTLFDGVSVDGGEIGCMMECFAARKQAGTFNSGAEDLDVCQSQCGASECGAKNASTTTLSLARCILGVKEGKRGCSDACGFAD